MKIENTWEVSYTHVEVEGEYNDFERYGPHNWSERWACESCKIHGEKVKELEEAYQEYIKNDPR